MVWQLHPPIARISSKVDEWMQGADMENREAAIAILAGYPNEALKHLPALVRELSGTNQWQLAAMTMAACGSAASNALPSLEAMLSGPDRRKNAIFAYAIAHIAPERMPEMAALLATKSEHATDSEQSEMVRYLREFGSKAYPALPYLMSRLQSAKNSDLIETAITIGAIGPAARYALPSLQPIAEGKRAPSPLMDVPGSVKQYNLERSKWMIEARLAMIRIDLGMAEDYREILLRILEQLSEDKQMQLSLLAAR